VVEIANRYFCYRRTGQNVTSMSTNV